MTQDDLDRIEHRLDLRLPLSYRRAVAPFPVPGLVGNSDSQIWDHADRLIELNERLRADAPGWPSWLFAVGQSEGDPSGYAIDTQSKNADLWWLEQMRLGPNSGPGERSFDPWFARWVVEVDNEPDSGSGSFKFVGLWLILSLSAVLFAWAQAIVRIRLR